MHEWNGIFPDIDLKWRIDCDDDWNNSTELLSAFSNSLRIVDGPKADKPYIAISTRIYEYKRAPLKYPL